MRGTALNRGGKRLQGARREIYDRREADELGRRRKLLTQTTSDTGRRRRRRCLEHVDAQHGDADGRLGGAHPRRRGRCHGCFYDGIRASTMTAECGWLCARDARRAAGAPRACTHDRKPELS